MGFDNFKKNCLSKLDKSKKGEIDLPIRKLVKIINSKKNYFTTSSCSGRIVLIAKKSKKKYDVSWIYSTHKKATYLSVMKSVKKELKCPVWLLMEPLIMHVCCRTIGDALRMLTLARRIGFKRSGIISVTQKITLEFTSSERVETIIADKGELLVDKEYIKILIDESNRKMESNLAKVKLLEKTFL